MAQWGDTLWTIPQADANTQSVLTVLPTQTAGSAIYYNPSANTVTLDGRQGERETVQAGYPPTSGR